MLKFAVLVVTMMVLGWSSLVQLTAARSLSQVSNSIAQRNVNTSPIPIAQTNIAAINTSGQGPIQVVAPSAVPPFSFPDRTPVQVAVPTAGSQTNIASITTGPTRRGFWYWRRNGGEPTSNSIEQENNASFPVPPHGSWGY